MRNTIFSLRHFFGISALLDSDSLERDRKGWGDDGLELNPDGCGKDSALIQGVHVLPVELQGRPLAEKVTSH